MTFHGIGGHGSNPQDTIDPVIMAAQAVTQLQTVVSRHIDPQKVGILTIGAINAGVDNNVISTESTIKLKLHFSDENVHKDMVERITSIVNGVATAQGVSEENLPTIRHKGFTPAVVNTPEFVTHIRAELESAEFVHTQLGNMPLAGSDDVA
ncbi:peptidase dimerization domain-containing protein [Vibrio sp. CAU 1672]|uniref:peptidase dimerization domain-containing protein n=1 Tax=Vibrio sp. CAU 1672 TaxID=3032594 RepID=UPI0023D99DFC|nr:peptidase dimerization domain-containing protein [Vibrio sp. CAU 1672]MDF2155799.1 peptidase dimerization domain-containing protein [Vibrio sp. CAU 1672]